MNKRKHSDQTKSAEETVLNEPENTIVKKCKVSTIKNDVNLIRDVGSEVSSSQFEKPAVGKTFGATFSFLKKTDLYKLPPQPKQTIVNNSIKNNNAIIVNPRQRGNPVIKHIHNIPWEYGDIVADYIVGQTTCALFLSLRYHNLNPDYLHERLKQLGHSYNLRVLLVLVDLVNSKLTLKELGKICILSDLTLMLAWSYEEAGRYLETYKSYEYKPADIIQEKVQSDFPSQIQNILTTVKSVNKNDAISLASIFGSFKKIINATPSEVSICPGFGTLKARKLHTATQEPFKRHGKTTVNTKTPEASNTCAKSSLLQTDYLNKKLSKHSEETVSRETVSRQTVPVETIPRERKIDESSKNESLIKCNENQRKNLVNTNLFKLKSSTAVRVVAEQGASTSTTPTEIYTPSALKTIDNKTETEPTNLFCKTAATKKTREISKEDYEDLLADSDDDSSDGQGF